MERLTRYLSWCECEGVILLLDLAADRYFRLAPRLEPSFRRHVAGQSSEADEAQLVQAGLALGGRGIPCDQISEAPPGTCGDLPPAPRAPPGGVVRALQAEALAAWRLRRQGLGPVLLDPPERKRVSRPAAEVAPEIAASFARSGLMFGISDRCLTRAIACRAICAAYGCPATIVLGVRAAPFQAHAWVQHASLVLVGDHDQVRAYTPILALA